MVRSNFESVPFKRRSASRDFMKDLRNEGVMSQEYRFKPGKQCKYRSKFKGLNLDLGSIPQYYPLPSIKWAHKYAPVKDRSGNSPLTRRRPDFSKGDKRNWFGIRNVRSSTTTDKARYWRPDDNQPPKMDVPRRRSKQAKAASALVGGNVFEFPDLSKIQLSLASWGEWMRDNMEYRKSWAVGGGGGFPFNTGVPGDGGWWNY